MKKLIYASLMLAITTSCTNPSEHTEEANTPAEQSISETPPHCTYSLDPATFSAEWVAYKFSDKKGVPGKFEDFTISGYNSGENIPEMISGAEFTINTSSLNTGDNARDPKIRDFFFNKLSNGSALTGKVTSVNGDMSTGSLEFALNMNGIDHPVSGAYKIENDKLEISAEINVDDWMAQEALKSLNTECKDLHKGIDGVSKLWPDVSLFASAAIVKTCD